MSDLQVEKKLTITQWSEDDRPREKLMFKGRSSLSDAELVAILIGSGTTTESAVDVAKRILQLCEGDLNKLGRLTLKDMCKIKGIGPAKAISIIAALELGRRRKDFDAVADPKLDNSSKIYEYMKPELLDLPTEQFWIVLLSQNLRPIRKVRIGEGGVSGVVADPKLVFHKALESLASHVVLLHNHPSGNLEPSKEDDRLTHRLSEAGIFLQINVLDHLIFTDRGFYSYKDSGKL